MVGDAGNQQRRSRRTGEWNDPSLLDSVAKEVKRLQSESSLKKSTIGRALLGSVIEVLVEELNDKIPYVISELDEELQIDRKLIMDVSETVQRNPDCIEMLYEELVETELRRSKGQFFTPKHIAEFMSLWGKQDDPSTVLDPAVGPGVFFEQMLKHGANDGGSVDLHGLDTDPLMLNLCFVRLLLLGYPRSRICLGLGDFLEMDFLDKRFDLVICNPPYLKFHNYDRNKAITAIEHRHGMRLSKLTNIYALFLMQAATVARKGARIAFITPSEFLYTGYGKELKRYLLSRFTIEAFLWTDFNKVVFKKALTTAIVTLLRFDEAPEDHEVKFIKVNRWPSKGRAMLNALSEFGEDRTSEDLSAYHVCSVPQASLNPDEKWQRHFRSSESLVSSKGLIPLKEVASTSRGIATGHNKYFVLSKDEVTRWGIEPSFLTPVITKTSQCRGYVFSKADHARIVEKDEKAHLLYCIGDLSENLRRYIEHGEEMSVHRRFLTSHRTPWYSMEKRRPAPILATVFSRDNMRFVLNDAEVLNLTAFHCIYPKTENRTEIKALLAYLNSGLFKKMQSDYRREYGGGLHKFEPRDLEELPLLDLGNVKKQNVKRLASMFDVLCQTDMDNQERIDSSIRQIDEFLSEVLIDKEE